MKLSPFGKEVVIVLEEGGEYAYAKLFLLEEQKGSTAVFSRGIVGIIESFSMTPEELEVFGREIYPTLFSSLPFTQGAGYSVFELCRKGYPLAGHALAQLSEFYRFSYDYQEFLQWTAIVSENS